MNIIGNVQSLSAEDCSEAQFTQEVNSYKNAIQMRFQVIEFYTSQQRFDEASAYIDQLGDIDAPLKRLQALAMKLVKQGKGNEDVKTIEQASRFGGFGKTTALKIKVDKLLHENKVQEAIAAASAFPAEAREAFIESIINKYLKLGELNEAEKLAGTLTTDFVKAQSYCAMVEHIIPGDVAVVIESWETSKEHFKSIPKENGLKAKRWALLTPYEQWNFREKAINRVAQFFMAHEQYNEALEVIEPCKERRCFHKDVSLLLLAHHFLSGGHIEKALELADSISSGYERLAVFNLVGAALIKSSREKEAIALGKGDFTKSDRQYFMHTILKASEHRLYDSDLFLDLLEVPDVEDIIEWTCNFIKPSAVIKFLQHGVRISRQQLDVYFSESQIEDKGRREINHAFALQDKTFNHINEKRSLEIEKKLDGTVLPIEVQRMISREYAIEAGDPKEFYAQYKAFEVLQQDAASQ